MSFWYTIYHHRNRLLKGQTKPSINRPTNGNLGHLCPPISLRFITCRRHELLCPVLPGHLDVKMGYPESSKSLDHFSIETTMVTTGNPLITRDITYLVSGMNFQVYNYIYIYFHWRILHFRNHPCFTRASPCLREHAVGRPMQRMVFNPFALCLDPWQRCCDGATHEFLGDCKLGPQKCRWSVFVVCWEMLGVNYM